MSNSPFPFPIAGRIELFATERDVRNAAYAQAEFSNKLHAWLKEPEQAEHRDQYKNVLELVPFKLNTIVVWDVLDSIGAYSIDNEDGVRFIELITAPEALSLRLHEATGRMALWKGTWEKLQHPRRAGERLKLFLAECNRTGIGLENHWYEAIKAGNWVPAFGPGTQPAATPQDRESASDFSNLIVLAPGDPSPPMDFDLP